MDSFITTFLMVDVITAVVLVSMALTAKSPVKGQKRVLFEGGSTLGVACEIERSDSVMKNTRGFGHGELYSMAALAADGVFIWSDRHRTVDRLSEGWSM